MAAATAYPAALLPPPATGDWPGGLSLLALVDVSGLISAAPPGLAPSHDSQNCDATGHDGQGRGFLDALIHSSPEELPGDEQPAGPVCREVLKAGRWDRSCGDGAGFASGGVADRLPPGATLAGLAAGMWDRGLERVIDDELIGVLRAARRLASWAGAMELAAAGELWRRRMGEEDAGDTGAGAGTGDEIAAALTLTGRSADGLLDLAVSLRRLPATSAALAAGDIDLPRAAVIVQELTGLTDEHAAAVESAVIGAAPRQTTGQLRRAAHRAVLAADPAAARRRKEQAEREARVERWTEPAGTAALAGRDLPPAEVLAADANLTALATQLKAAGVEGTMDTLRAKIYLALLTGAPLTSLLPTSPTTSPWPPAAPITSPGASPSSPCPPAAPVISPSARPSSTRDARTRDGRTGGSSPHGNTGTGKPADRSNPRSPGDGPSSGSPSGSSPSPGKPADRGSPGNGGNGGTGPSSSRSRGKPVAPARPGSPGDNPGSTGDGRPGGGNPAAGKPADHGRPSNPCLGAAAPSSPCLGAAAPSSPSFGPGLSGRVNLTLPLATWLGGSDAPGHVPGFGPLDAADSRALADALAARAGSKWCLTLTGTDGTPVAHGCGRVSPGAGKRRDPPTARSPDGSPGTSVTAPSPGTGAATPPPSGTRAPGPPPETRASGPPSGTRDAIPPAAWTFTISLLEQGQCGHVRQTAAYRPSPALHHLIEVRQATCTFPGCSRPATRCDQDHTVPYHLGGRTCECNLAPLCRRHHQVKQTRGWTLEQTSPGIMTWTTPAGRRYTTTPTEYPS